MIEQPFITGYYFRYPLSKWSDGRVAILGDAAHPMHPFLAQGACQAMEDAAVLAAVLAKRGAGAVPSALTEYERLRFDRASRVQNQARTHEHLWHMIDPREITERNKVLASTMDLDPFAETVWGWLFRYDAEQRAAAGAEEPWGVMQRPEAQRAWSGLPPSLAQVASNEALYSDSERMVAAAQRDQVDVEFDVYDDSVHGFPVFTFLPESRQALQTIGDFVTKRVSP